MIDFSLAREIYGMTPWFVDQQSFPGLMGILNAFQTGANFEPPKTKYNTPHVLEISSESRVITRPFELNNNDNFEGIGIINIDGPITVSGGNSTLGMRQLSSIMETMALDERIKSFILLVDSGGGSSGAVQIMVDTINEIKQTKSVIAVVKKGGLAASAAFGIISASHKIFAESEMSIVGSAGTMVQFEGREANSKDNTGLKHIRIFASKSTQKNKGFEEALNNDNFSIIIDEMLNPINENFLKTILSNRPALEGTNFDDGRIVFAKDAIGTFIDGIKSFSDVVNMSINSNSNNFEFNNQNKGLEPNNNNNNLNKETMTITELKQNHPELYSSIFQAGEVAERDRVGSWMAHSQTDLPAVKAGIESGKDVSATQREEFLVKAASLSHLDNLKDDTKQTVKTAESKTKTADDEASAEVEDFYGEIDSKLGILKT